MPPMEVGSRLARLRPLLDEHGVDALFVSSLRNVRYLTGFTGSNGLLLVRRNDAVMFTDGRYESQAADQLAACDVRADVITGKGEVLVAAVKAAGRGVRRLGFEAEHITWSQKQRIVDGWLAECEAVGLHGVVERLRYVKDAGEIARIAEGCHLGDAALQNVLPMFGERPSEKQIALALEYEMRKGGAEAVWAAIVASGRNGAQPHHVAGDDRIEAGVPVVLDFGAIVDGYHSDMTRTVCLGEPRDSSFSTMHEVVGHSQQAALRKVVPGNVAADVDRAAREVLADHDASWAASMTHGSGHGIGLDIHESPILNPHASEVLVAGQVITVEPGVYLEDRGGVRTEDTVLISDSGWVSLTKHHRELIVA